MFHRLVWNMDRGEPMAPKGADRRVVLDLLLGLRVIDMDMDVKLDLNDGSTVKTGGSKTFAVVFIGGRSIWELSEKCFFQGRFDWGFGEAIEFNVSLGLGYQFSRTIGLTLDWRWLHIDYADGGGDSRFKFDGSLSGPSLALTIQF